MRLPACLLGLLLSCSTLAASLPDAVVDTVQMPAWLQRSGRQVPLAPGQEIHAGDRVLTGEGARAYLKLGEGSTVKLGASAQFTFEREPAEPALFKAAMNVLTGAFRFTTAAVQKLRRRDVAIRRGTNCDLDGDGAAGAGAVVHDDLLAELVAEFLRVEPREGVRVAAGVAYEHAHRPGGIGLFRREQRRG